MPQKKKLLVVTTRFPWPLTNGFASKNHWLIRNLAEEFETDLYVVQRQPVPDRDLDRIRPYCGEVRVFRPSTADVLKSATMRLLGDQPLQIALFSSRELVETLRERIDRYDLLFGSVIRSAQYVLGTDKPVIFDLADSLGQLYVRDAAKFSGLKKLVYLEEGRRLTKYEHDVVHRATKTFFFNKAEASRYPAERVEVVPHGVDPRLFEPQGIDPRCGDGVVFFGKMDFEPNVQAALWFAENVMPLLPEHIRMYVIGVSPNRAVQALARQDPRVEVLGFVEDPYPLIRGALASVCPVQIGGGIQNKVIESLAVGALCMISPLAAVPFGELDQSGVIVCDAPAEWARTIATAAADPKAYDARRVLGPAYAARHFSWEAYGRIVRDTVRSAIAAHARDPRGRIEASDRPRGAHPSQG